MFNYLFTSTNTGLEKKVTMATFSASLILMFIPNKNIKHLFVENGPVKTTAVFLQTSIKWDKNKFFNIFFPINFKQHVRT